ncbi:hypothetical protein [Butyrivibrio sp. MB2005]|uniref:hypothetical protein n=1 Tax=Butyrivibrio sp. MB2005 TaxID=1280678 RepID=UPI000410F92F|nr:hypothetical protein [Butyrivibrio sp. MB2005]
MKGRKRRLINILLATLLVFAIFTNSAAPANAASIFTMASAKKTASIKFVAGKAKIKIYLGDAYKLNCNLNNPKWSTSNKDVIRVDAAKNTLYAVGVGTATVTAKKGGKKISRKVEVQALKGMTISNTAAVSGGGTPVYLTVGSENFSIQSIITYHYNGGKGKKPGTISIYKYNKDTQKRGKKVFTVKANGLFGNTYWNATCLKKLSKGYYVVEDSNPKTWSQNTDTDGAGFTWIYYTCD